jgi:Uncharacterized conserved protein (DUF2190)
MAAPALSGDYAPVYGRPQSVTYTASGAVKGGQVLFIVAMDTVSETAGKTGAIAGVAGHDAASGAKVTVLGGAGVVHETRTTAAGVAAGDLLDSAAGGCVVAGASAGSEIGVALRAVGADGGILRWVSRRM